MCVYVSLTLSPPPPTHFFQFDVEKGSSKVDGAKEGGTGRGSKTQIIGQLHTCFIYYIKPVCVCMAKKGCSKEKAILVENIFFTKI